MRKLAAAAVLALALAGCGDTAAPGNDSTGRIRMANPASDKLKAMSPLYQRVGLVRAVRDSGKRCGSVDRLAYQQEYEQLAMWVAQCDDGRIWSVFIAPNENVQVRLCTEHVELGLPPCRELPPLPPDPADPAANKAQSQGS